MIKRFFNFRHRERENLPNLDGATAAAALFRLAALPADEVPASLGTSTNGLSADEVATRRLRFGANLLPRCPKRPWYFELAANLFHLLALLLWAAAALSWMLRTPEVAMAIVAVIAINGVFSFWQEYEAERAAEALQHPHQVTVRRASRLSPRPMLYPATFSFSLKANRCLRTPA